MYREKLEGEKMMENIQVRMERRRNRIGSAVGQTKHLLQVGNTTEEPRCVYALARRQDAG